MNHCYPTQMSTDSKIEEPRRLTPMYTVVINPLTEFVIFPLQNCYCILLIIFMSQNIFNLLMCVIINKFNDLQNTICLEMDRY